MRSDRLIAIMLLLQARGQMPAAKLASHLEVSVRTIMRDVEAVRGGRRSTRFAARSAVLRSRPATAPTSPA